MPDIIVSPYAAENAIKGCRDTLGIGSAQSKNNYLKVEVDDVFAS
jgi:hypothetical protein